MATYAKGHNGNISGVVALTGASFNIKVEDFNLGVTRAIDDVSGFGDGGNSYFCEGINQWAVGISGRLLTSGSAGAANLMGTFTTFGNITLTADTGKTYTGSVRMRNMRVSEGYKGGVPRVTFQAQGEGALTESW